MKNKLGLTEAQELALRQHLVTYPSRLEEYVLYQIDRKLQLPRGTTLDYCLNLINQKLASECRIEETYWSTEFFVLKPEFFLRCAKTLTKEKAAQLVKSVQHREDQKTACLGFLQLLIAQNHGRTDELQPIDSSLDEYALSQYWELSSDLFLALAIDPQWARVVQYFPHSWQVKLWQKVLRLQERFGLDEPIVKARTVFENLPALAPQRDGVSDWFEFYGVFLREGNLDACLSRMHEGTVECAMMHALKAFSESNAAAALEAMRGALRLNGRPRMFKSFFPNFLYGAALYGDRLTPSTQKAVQTLLSYSKLNEPCAEALRIYVLMAGRGSGGRTNNGGGSSYDQSQISLEQSAVTCLILHGYRFGELDKTQIEELGKFCSERAYLNLEFCRQFGTPEALKAAQEKVGMTSTVIERVRERERWEITLDELIESVSLIQDEKPVEKSSERERVSYLLDCTNWTIQPRIQKSKDGIVWSRGRIVAISAFVKLEDELPERDRPLVKAVTTARCGRSVQMSLERNAVPLLIGHPYVYDADQPEVRLEVVRIPFQLHVTQKKERFVVRSNVPEELTLSAGECYVFLNGDTQVEVIEPTDFEVALCRRLRAETIPPEAKEKFTKLLEGVSRRTTVMSDLLGKNAGKGTKKAGESRITFRIQPADERFSVNAFVRPIAGAPLTCEPGEGLRFISTTDKGASVQVERDLSGEVGHFSTLNEALMPLEDCRESPYSWSLDTEACLEFLNILHENEADALIEWPQKAQLRVNRPTIQSSDLRLSLRPMGNWFEMDGEVRLDDKTKITVAALLEKLREAKGNFIVLGESEYVALSDSLKKQLSLLEGVAARGRKKDSLLVSRFNAASLGRLENEGVEVEAEENFRSLLSRIQDAKALDVTVPSGLRAELRDYQRDGFEWLSQLAHWGAGALLADDMGLGKTVQAIALLLSRAKTGPALVAAPASVLFNWADEIARFAPGLKVVVFNREDREAAVKNAAAGEVFLTTYGVLAGEIEMLKTVSWQCVVLDEAHTIKNRETKMSKAVMELTADFRLLLTGTPLQNHLSEIWNLFEFANPGLLGSFKQFSDRFIIPIEKNRDRERQRFLKRLISPFILRRTKAEVLDELPEKTEVTLRVTLSEAERALYENLRERASISLEAGEINPIEALAELTRLRQAACHPKLVNPSLSIGSAKTEAFLDLVETLRGNGHRALVFSQFTSHLALIRKELETRGIPYLYLDGADSPSRRTALVEEFQQGEMPLFLISLKAGGTGLNLTAADYVIHLDPWWNPAIEDQASDRAYRIGQDQPVTIYRLIAENTIEDKILKLHETKRSLADALLEGADMTNRLSRDEILKLLSAE